MPRTDTRYIFTANGKTYIARWSQRKGLVVKEDDRTADGAMDAACKAGWEGRFAGGSGFGTKTTEVLCKYFGFEWEAHSIVAKYEES